MTTAFAGAYMIMRGISYYAGSQINEFSLISKLKAGDSYAFDQSTYYIYLAIVYLLAIAGFVIQYLTERAVCVMEDEDGEERKANE